MFLWAYLALRRAWMGRNGQDGVEPAHIARRPGVKKLRQALYAIEPNFPPGKRPGRAEFSSVYFNMSQGGPDTQGPWNSGPKWRVVDDPAQQMAVDGGDGGARVGLTPAEETVLSRWARSRRGRGRGGAKQSRARAVLHLQALRTDRRGVVANIRWPHKQE